MNYELDIWTLLSTVVNLHTVSHFKSDAFSYLKYAMDFGSIVKESWKKPPVGLQSTSPIRTFTTQF